MPRLAVPEPEFLGHGIGGQALMSWTTFDSLNFPQLFAIVAVGNVCFWHFSDIPSAPMNVRYRG
jgi:hypothetical protein